MWNVAQARPVSSLAGKWRLPPQHFVLHLSESQAGVAFMNVALVNASRQRSPVQPMTALPLFGASNGHGSKLNHQGTAGFGPCFHLPGFRFGYIFLTHSQITTGSRAPRPPARRARAGPGTTRCTGGTRERAERVGGAFCSAAGQQRDVFPVGWSRHALVESKLVTLEVQDRGIHVLLRVGFFQL